MISLEQILLLENKVESAVAKIAQLQAENDALRTKCSELTNALSAKSEQLSNFENDQNKIESGILKALDRLSSIENTVLQAVQTSSVNAVPENQNHFENPSSPEEEKTTNSTSSEENSYNNVSNIREESYSNSPADVNENSFSSSINPYAVSPAFSKNTENNATEESSQEEERENPFAKNNFFDLNVISDSSEENYSEETDTDNQEYTEDLGNPEDDQTNDNGQFDIF